MKQCDLIVVGSGSAMNIVDPMIQGNSKIKIAGIDKDEPGGICLTRGCIPSKIMVYPAELVRTLDEAKALGLDVEIKNVSYEKIMRRMRSPFWDDRAGVESSFRTNFFALETTRGGHIGKDPNPELYDPDLWTDEKAFLDKPGQADIQSDMMYDYRTNVDAYPKWQTWMRERRPHLLVTWGTFDPVFDPGEAERYRREVPKAEVHLLDAGHFALDTKAQEIGAFVGSFMKNTTGV